MTAASLRRSIELKKAAIQELADRAEQCENDARMDEIAWKIGKLHFQILENERMLKQKNDDFITL